MNRKGLVFTKDIGSHFATQGVFDIVFMLPLFILSDSGDKGDTSTQATTGEAAQDLEGEERKDALGSLPMSHQHDQ